MKSFKLRSNNQSPEAAVRNMVCSWMQLQESKGIAHGTVVDTKGYFDANKGFYRKPNHPYRKVGTPDWMGLWRGRALCIEFKAPEVRDAKGKLIRRKGCLSSEQFDYLKKASERGGICIVAHSLDDVLRVLRISDEQMGIKWTSDINPPGPREPTRQGMVMINGQFAGFADTIEELAQVMEAKDERQVDIEDLIKKGEP